ncbi:MAG: FecR domain-containing protein [Verrucomicrobiota bacterium]
MKQIRPFISGLVVCGIALAMAASAMAQSAQQGLAKVVTVKGSARYMTGVNTAWQPLKTGALLKPGAIIQTASGSYVDLVLNNPDAVGTPLSAMSSGGSSGPGAGAGGGSGMAYQPKAEQDAVRVFENTVLSIDKLTVDQTGMDTVTETQLDLKAGRIFGTVKKLSTASKYEIKIPNGVAGIRGTIFYISADGVIRVLTGSVVMAFVGADGTVSTQVVGSGQQFDARSGQLSPMVESAIKDLSTIARELRLHPLVPPLFFTTDHTIYCLSPTQPSGQGGH